MKAALAPRQLRRRIEHGVNCRDIEDVIAGFADDAILEVGGDSCAAGRFVGIAEVRRWYERWFTRMSALDYVIHEVAAVKPWEFVKDNTVFVSFSVHEISHDGVEARLEGVATYEIRAGEISRLRICMYDDTGDCLIWGHRSDAR